MGYRLTFYNCPKSVIEKYKNLTDEDFKYNDSYDTVDSTPYPYEVDGVEEMWYDLTMWLYFKEFEKLCQDKQEEKIWSRVFSNKLNIEDDFSFNTMNKEQFRNFIDMVRRHISSIYERDCLDSKGTFELANLQKGKIKYEDLEDRYVDRNDFFSKINAVEKARHIAVDYSYERDVYKLYYGNDDDFNKNLEEDKYTVAFGCSWQSVLYNLIFVYKTFDWENNCILVCGG